ncbi:MAG: PEP-CTERM sorting domain-containing protein [Alphaproteobacteria bacterium]|nr:PEP-CTERM sorting domain-containing protein [Alphaproteobacteria bacterium]
MMRFKKLVLAVLLALGASAGAANAGVLYTLTLTSTGNSTGAPLSTYNGTGTIDLAFAPPASGLANLGTAAVTFLIDGHSFSGTASSVQFLNGGFWNASFSQQIGSNPNRFSLGTTSGYVYYYGNLQQQAFGTISAAPAPAAAVPEPVTLSLFGAGLAGAAALRRRKKTRKA